MGSIEMDSVIRAIPEKNTWRGKKALLFDPTTHGIKVTAHTWAIFFQKNIFFHFLIFCSISYYKKNNAF